MGNLVAHSSPSRASIEPWGQLYLFYDLPIMYPVKHRGEIVGIVEQRFKLFHRVFLGQVEHEFFLHLWSGGGRLTT